MSQPTSTLKSKSKYKSRPLSKHQTSPSPTSPPTETLTQIHDSLTPLLQILQAVAHRHRNQHSSSHWWRPFGLLRRATRSLAASLLRRPHRSHDEHPAVVHAKWMASHIVPRAYVAFTQLAADNQHAPLGLMLLAVLARTNRLLSDLVPPDHTAPEANPSPAGSSIAAGPKQGSDFTPSSAETKMPDHDLDVGVAVSRDSLTISETCRRQASSTKTEETSFNATKADKLPKASSKDASKDRLNNSKEKKKKKKKGGDAFSNLFASL